MKDIKVMMYAKEGHALVKEPFTIRICEVKDGKEQDIPIEEGDKFVVV